MPRATRSILTSIERHLRSGPVVFGETHSQIYAREAIVQLIALRAVHHLSIEAPVVPENRARSDGQIASGSVTAYSRAFSEVYNADYSLSKIISIAVARKIPTYCHDMPAKATPMRALDTNYILFAGRYGRSPMRPDQLTNMLPQRNRFAAKFLKEKLGKGVNILQGLIVLAGDHHTLADECGGNANTIQTLLGIPEERVYHLD